MKHRWQKIAFVLTVLTLATTTLFQNCGGAFDPQHSAGGFHHLEYPYINAPLVYRSQNMKVEALDVGTRLVYVASLASPLGENVHYEVMVKNADQEALCPTQSGVLVEGQSTVEVSCVSLKDLRGAQLELRVSTPSGTESYLSTLNY